MNSSNENDEPTLYDAIINQQWKIAHLLIEDKAQLSNDSWSSKYKKVIPNIIHYAIQDHTVEESFIDFLLSSQIQTESKIIHIEQVNEGPDGYTPILTAARSGNLRILKHLIDNHKPNVHAMSLFNGHNLFHCAILSYDKCTIELLDTINLLGVDVKVFDAHQLSTPLTLAILNGLSFEIIKHLVKLGADIIIPCDRKYNPRGDKAKDCNVHLFRAIRSKDDNYQLFNYLVEQCPISSPISLKSILKEEFTRGNIESVKLIIEKHRMKFDNDQHKIDLFQSMFQGFRSTFSLFCSSQFSQQVKMIEYLLNQKVQNCFNFDSNNRFLNRKSTPLLLLTAYPQSNLELLKLMVQNGANVDDVDDVDDDDVDDDDDDDDDDVDDDDGDDDDDYDDDDDEIEGAYGYGVLQHLCRIRENTTVEDIIQKIDYFISMGVDVNYINDIHPKKKGRVTTALHLATANKQFSSILVPYLIQHHKADITLSNDQNAVALHKVVEPELVPLLSSPLTINHQDYKLYTPLLSIIQNPYTFKADRDKYLQIISKLIECGANVNIPNKLGHFPIQFIFKHIYFQQQPIEVIELIIKQHVIENSDLNLLGFHKFTPLQLAIQQFVQFGDHPSKETDSIDREVTLKAIQSIKLLLQYGANITTPISKGRTLLHYIVMNVDMYNGYDDIGRIDDDLVDDFMVTIIDGIIDQTITNQ